jgi:hypothetical protein
MRREPLHYEMPPAAVSATRSGGRRSTSSSATCAAGRERRRFFELLPGEGSPGYLGYGFVETGEFDEGERVIRLELGG